jgi:hypothetical protein
MACQDWVKSMELAYKPDSANDNGVHSASWKQLRSYLKEIVAAPV